MGPRRAGDPPQYPSTPPRPPDPNNLRMKLQIEIEETAAGCRELQKSMASMVTEQAVFQSEILHELRQLRLERTAQVMEPSVPTSSVPIISSPVTQPVSSVLQFGTIDSYRQHQQLYQMPPPLSLLATSDPYHYQQQQPPPPPLSRPPVLHQQQGVWYANQIQYHSLQPPSPPQQPGSSPIMTMGSFQVQDIGCLSTMVESEIEGIEVPIGVSLENGFDQISRDIELQSEYDKVVVAESGNVELKTDVAGADATQLLEELERESGTGSYSSVESYDDCYLSFGDDSQRVDGQIVSSSDKEVNDSQRVDGQIVSSSDREVNTNECFGSVIARNGEPALLGSLSKHPQSIESMSSPPLSSIQTSPGPAQAMSPTRGVVPDKEDADKNRTGELIVHDSLLTMVRNYFQYALPKCYKYGKNIGGTCSVVNVFDALCARLKHYIEGSKKSSHYVLQLCFSGFDKKVRDKGGGHTILTDGLFILHKEFVGNMRLLWVKFIDIILIDVHTLVNDFLVKLKKCKMEGLQTMKTLTVELLRGVISSQRVPYTNQAGALIDVLKVVGEQLIATNLMELGVGNIVRQVLHIIMEEDVSLTIVAMAGLNLSTVSNDEDDGDRRNYPILYVAIVAAAARSTLCPLSLQILLEDIHDAAAIPHTSSSGGDSEGKNKSADKRSKCGKLKHDVIEPVDELIQDIGTCHEQLAEQAVEHILHNEVILTLGNSKSILEFLFAAKEKKRSFRVIVAEGAPRYQGLITNGIGFNSFWVHRNDGCIIVLCSNMFQKMNKLQLYVEVVHKGTKLISLNDSGNLLGDGNGIFYLVFVKNENSTQHMELVFLKENGCMFIGYDITDEKTNVHIVREHEKKAFDEKWVVEIAKKVVMDMTNARLYTTTYTEVITGICKTLQLYKYEIRNSDGLFKGELARHFPHIKSASTSLRYCSSAISINAIVLLYVALVMCVTALGVRRISKVGGEFMCVTALVLLLIILRQSGISKVGGEFIYDNFCLQFLLVLVSKMLQTWTWENTEPLQTQMTVSSFLCSYMVIIRVDDALEPSSWDKDLIKENSTYELAPKNFGPFQVIARIGKVAYKLELPPTAKVHPVYHVSLLKKKLGDSMITSSHLPPDFDSNKENWFPDKIVDRGLFKHGNSSVVKWLIKWKNGTEEDSTWEEADSFQLRFPDFKG